MAAGPEQLSAWLDGAAPLAAAAAVGGGGDCGHCCCSDGSPKKSCCILMLETAARRCPKYEEIAVAEWVRRFVPGSEGTLLARRSIWRAPDAAPEADAVGSESAGCDAAMDTLQRLPHAGAPLWTATARFPSTKRTVVCTRVPHVAGANVLSAACSPVTLPS